MSHHALPAAVLTLIGSMFGSMGYAAAGSAQEDRQDQARGQSDVLEIPGSPGERMSDDAVAAAVGEALYDDPVIVFDTIDVTAEDGTVTLTGTAPNLLSKDRAGRIAETVRGVRQVVNEIRVQQLRDVGGERLETEIAYALRNDPATERSQIRVQAGDRGAVVLSGSVESWAERHLAEQTAKSISGVLGLRNDIEVTYDSERPDSEIANEVRRVLQWDEFVDSAFIDVSVDEGIVTLSGSVPSAAERRRAAGLSWVAGVEHVNVVPLEVEPLASKRRESPAAGSSDYVLRNDREIAQAIRRALRADPRVDTQDIEVGVEDGIVTLSGTVGLLRAKHVAEAAAYGLLGVASVRNRLRVRVGEHPPPDMEIRERIERALARHAYTEDEEIEVRVNRGKVALAGRVDSWLERGIAEDLAGTVRGVRALRNNLAVDADPERLSYNPYVDSGIAPGSRVLQQRDGAGTALGWSDAAIEQEVKDELWWSPYVDAQNIEVNVDSGIVTLIGAVSSPAEERAAVENALQGGAVRVVNRLEVRRPPR